MAFDARVEEGRSFTKTVVLEGRLDSNTVATLDRELDAVLASPVKVVVFDLSKEERYVKVFGVGNWYKKDDISGMPPLAREPAEDSGT